MSTEIVTRTDPSLTRIAQGRADDVDASVLDIASGHLMALITSSAGVEMRSRRYRLHHFAACFVGVELVDLLVQHLGCSRGQAEQLGRRLLAQGHIAHVMAEHDFIDGHYFYRVGFPVHDESMQGLMMPPAQLAELARAMRGFGGVRVGTHRYRLVRYPNCFIGQAATDWLAERLGETRANAERVGDAMLRANHIRHVFDEVGFRDGRYFYRFL